MAMPFQIICLKNKKFLSRVVSIMAGFAFVICAMAVIFPASKDKTEIMSNHTTQATYTTQTTDTETENA